MKTIKVLNRASGVYEPSATTAVTCDDARRAAARRGPAHREAGAEHRPHADRRDRNRNREGRTRLRLEKGTIRAVDFEAGTRYRTLETDLGFYEHSVQVRPRMDGKGWVVAVAVLNEGLVASNSSYKLRGKRKV